MEEKFLKQAIGVWKLQVNRVSRIIEALNPEQLNLDVAPGKNSGIYVLGHLIAVDDAISEILGTGKRAYPELHAPFVQNGDKSGLIFPPAEVLKDYFFAVHKRLEAEFETIKANEWLGRHNAMTDQDFILNPDRNKLSVLLNRTNHLSFHLGQLRLLY